MRLSEQEIIDMMRFLVPGGFPAGLSDRDVLGESASEFGPDCGTFGNGGDEWISSMLKA